MKPGIGHVELVELDMTPRCDDGSLDSGSPLIHWVNHLFVATQEHGKPLAYNVNTGLDLETQGFKNIHHEVIQVPLNPWPLDPRQRHIGRWFHLCLTESLEPLSLAPMTRISGWTKAQVNTLIDEARREINSGSVHAYFDM